MGALRGEGLRRANGVGRESRRYIKPRVDGGSGVRDTGRPETGKFQVAREAGRIRQIEIEQVRFVGGVPQLDQILRLDRDGAQRLIDVVSALQHVPVEGGETTVRIDDQTLRDFFADPDAMARLYERDPERIRELIESDTSAEDVVALAHRCGVVQRFRELQTDEGAFDEAQRREGGGPERVMATVPRSEPVDLGDKPRGPVGHVMGPEPPRAARRWSVRHRTWQAR